MCQPPDLVAAAALRSHVSCVVRGSACGIDSDCIRDATAAVWGPACYCVGSGQSTPLFTAGDSICACMHALGCMHVRSITRARTAAAQTRAPSPLRLRHVGPTAACTGSNSRLSLDRREARTHIRCRVDSHGRGSQHARGLGCDTYQPAWRMVPSLFLCSAQLVWQRTHTQSHMQHARRGSVVWPWVQLFNKAKG